MASESKSRLLESIEEIVRAFISPEADLSCDRVLICDGTREPTGLEIELYELAARLPKEPWRALSAFEKTALMRESEPTDTGLTVSIVKFPAEALDFIRSKTIKTITDALLLPTRASEVASKARLDVLLSIRRTIDAFVHDVCRVKGDLIAHGIMSHPPNLVTVTRSVDPSRHFKFIGLHVDGWEEREVCDRAASGNRVCLNVGTVERYFLFVPIGVREMLKMMEARSGRQFASTYFTGLGREFMDMFPEAPVVRCCVKPGEAYIAPTENIIHDGSSWGQPEISQHLTFRGGHIFPKR